MRPSQWAQQHHRSILFLLAILAIGGAAASAVLPVGLFPRVTFPRVVVSIDAGDRPAERMAIEVTWPVEESIRSVPGVTTVRSTTSRGSAEITVNFGWHRDMIAAKLQVESAIGQILPSLPQGTSFQVRRMDPTVFPVIGYSLTSSRRTLVELRDIATFTIQPILSAVPGVARIGILGGAFAEYQVVADPAKLASYGLTIGDVATALSASNVVTAVGRLEDLGRLYLVVSDTRMHDMAEISRTVLRSGSTGLVLLEDVAVVSKGVRPQWTRVTADGRDAVLFQVYQQPDGNTVQIARDVAAKLAAVRAQLPDDVHIANWYDQSDLIVASATSVRDAVLIGVLLAAVTLFVFLRNLRITAIAIVCVPTVLATSVLILYVLGMSFNIMTLGGMAAAVGLIVDDAIVLIEHIMRRLSATSDVRSTVERATVEFTRPLAGSSLATIIIFAPLAFLSGVAGAFFKALSITMGSALINSFLVTFFAVPLLAARFLANHSAVEPSGQSRPSRIHALYARLLERVLRRPVFLLVIVVPLVACGYLSYRYVGSGFMPATDEGGFVLDYRAPPGTSLTETDRLLREVEGILRTTPEVSTYSRRTGLQLGGGLTEANEGDFFVRLIPPPRRGIDEVMNEVRSRVEQTVPGLQIEMVLLIEDEIGDLTAVPQPIEVKIFSDDGKLLQSLAPKVAELIAGIRGVVDINDGIVLAGDALEIEVDREKVALEGMSPDDVTTLVEQYVTGVVSTSIQESPKMVGLRALIPASFRARAADIENLLLRAPDGHFIPLRRVAKVTTLTGQPQIVRDDLKRMVAVTARISGRDLGSTVAEVRAKLDRSGLLPPGVYYTLGGLYEQQRIAFRGMVAVFLGAVLLVFALLLFLYESFRVAVAMIVTTLLSISAVFVGLLLTGTELNISALMGMTMIIGIVTEVSIFYYSEYYDDRETRDPYERYILAGIHRMRPIAMTTVAAILALTPLALAIGRGAQMQQPLAIAIISGLIVQMPLVLLVLPGTLALLGHRGPVADQNVVEPPAE